MDRADVLRIGERSFSSTQDVVPNPNGHNHMPTPAVLKMVGEGYA